jgi:hypothetical protein
MSRAGHFEAVVYYNWFCNSGAGFLKVTRGEKEEYY